MAAMRRVATLAALVIGLGCAGCGSSGPTRTYVQPSPSMEPTFKIGQQLVVSLNPHYVPKVGDIVAFHPPAGADPATPVCGNPNEGVGHSQACDAPTSKESSQTFIKRIVAGPGDTIRMINGHVYVNGVPAKESNYKIPCGGGPSCDFPAPIKIPPGDYFLLGDNRGASDDSRFWGPVPRAWIIGKVIHS